MSTPDKKAQVSRKEIGRMNATRLGPIERLNNLSMLLDIWEVYTPKGTEYHARYIKPTFSVLLKDTRKVPVTMDTHKATVDDWAELLVDVLIGKRFIPIRKATTVQLPSFMQNQSKTK